MKYEIKFLVPDHLLGTLIDMIHKHQGCVFLDSKVQQEGEVKSVASRYKNGSRDKGISGEDLLLQSLKNGPKCLDQLQDIFEARGFARSTPAALVSQMARANKIKRANGEFHL